MADVQIPDLGEVTQMSTGDFLPFRQTSASLDKRLAWSNLIANFNTTDPVNWLAQTAKIQASVSNTQAVLAVIGDSWVQAGAITQRLNTLLQTDLGNAGDGYVGIGMSHGAPSSSITYTRVGTWIDVDNYPLPVGRGVDIADATSTDTATPAKVTIVGTFNTAVIHFIKMSGGGDFRWRVDAGSWTTVTTANATEIYATTIVTGLSTASHTLEIEVSSAGSSGVRLLGVDCQRTANGVRIHRLGNGGATAYQYANADTTIWQAGLAALSPTSVAILLGTNDYGFTPSVFGSYLDTIASRIRSAVPLADVIFLSSADNGLTGHTYPPSQYRDEMRNAAIRNGGLFIDTYGCIGNYTDGNTRGLYANSSHPSTAGYYVMANRIKSVLAR